MENLTYNLCVVGAIVTLIAFVCNIVASNPKRKHMSIETWDNGRVRYIANPKNENHN